MGTVVRHTPGDLKEFEAAHARNPSVAKLIELTVEYAEDKGGIVLEFWKLHQGQFFGLPQMMTVDEVAKRLKIPVSRANAILEETNSVIIPKWKASPEYEDPHAQIERMRRQD